MADDYQILSVLFVISVNCQYVINQRTKKQLLPTHVLQFQLSPGHDVIVVHQVRHFLRQILGLVRVDTEIR